MSKSIITISAADTVIPAQGKVIVPTDISIAVPEGCYGRVAPRSGLAAKHFLDTGAGVIDADYRGPVGVVMFNFSKVDYEGKEKKRNYFDMQGCLLAVYLYVYVFTHPLLLCYSYYFFLVKKGDRIAQLVLERIYTPDVLEVEVITITTTKHNSYLSKLHMS